MAWVAFDRAVKAVEQFRLDGAGRPLAAAARRDPRRGLPQGSTEAEHVRAVVRLDAARRQPADDPAGRLPARRRPAGARDGRGDREAPDGRRLRPPLRLEHATSTASRPARGPSCPAPSGWPTTSRCWAARRGPRHLRAAARDPQRRRPARRGIRPRRRAASSATSRRRSRTSAWSTPPTTFSATAARPCTVRRIEVNDPLLWKDAGRRGDIRRVIWDGGLHPFQGH